MILEPKKRKSVTVSTFSPSICDEVRELDVMISVFLMLILRQFFHSPLFPLSRDSCSSLLSAIKGISSAYMRLLIFLQAILIPAYDLSSLAFLHNVLVYKLKEQGDNIQP